MPLVEYICKKCKKRFSKRDDAVRCEKSHLQVKKAKAVQYGISPYLVLIEATFGDGKPFAIFRKRNISVSRTEVNI